ncbi:hypothetical protein [Bradyrhizobium sp.]|uniref:hypothetical protein n=1 Tax=Bradyrhizobium sp. TaxID=376 RepID=UPI003C618004
MTPETLLNYAKAIDDAVKLGIGKATNNRSPMDFFPDAFRKLVARLVREHAEREIGRGGT